LYPLDVPCGYLCNQTIVTTVTPVHPYRGYSSIPLTKVATQYHIEKRELA